MTNRIAGLWVAAFVLTAVSAVGGQTTVPAIAPASQPSPEMARLVQALSASSFAERDAAQKKLEDLGPEAAPDLRATLAQTADAEIQARVARALALLEFKAKLAPTLVSLDLTDAGPEEVIEALEKAIGRPIQIFPPPYALAQENLKVTLKFEKVSFWEAIAQLSRQMPMQASRGTGPDQVVLQIGKEYKGGAKWQQGTGPFAFRLLDLTRTNTVRLDGKNDQVRANFIARILIMADPRLHLAKVPEPPVLTRALDDKGHSLLSTADLSSTTYGGCAWEHYFPLSYPKGAGTRIAVLAGTTKITVTTKTAALEIDKLAIAEPVQRPLLGMTCTIQSIESPKKDELRVKIVFDRGTMDPKTFQGLFEWNHPALGILLVDAAGRILPRQEWGTEMGAKMDQRIHTYTFHLASQYRVRPEKFVPVKFRLEIPEKTEEIDVPFEFKDLPLP